MGFRKLTAGGVLLTVIVAACSPAPYVQPPTRAPLPESAQGWLESTPTPLPTPLPAPPPTPAPTPSPTPPPTAPPVATTPPPAPTPSPAPAASMPVVAFDVPNMREVECPPSAFAHDAPERTRCGYITVPESRAADDGRTLDLFFAVFGSSNPNPRPDPVLYLDGGPGAHTYDHLAWDPELTLEPFIGRGHVISLDQRGAGRSVPGLECDSFEATRALLLPTAGEVERAMTEDFVACGAKLREAGVNLSAFTTAENAADVNDLTQALGLEAWNVYGGSYGTRLALIAMRDHGDGIRSAILDSPYPPQADYVDEALALNEMVLAVFHRCAADAACSASFQDLSQSLADTTVRLTTNPVEITLNDPFAALTQSAVALDGRVFVEAVVAMLTDGRVSMLPEAVSVASAGDYSAFVGDLAPSTFVPYSEFSFGMFLAFTCNENHPLDPSLLSRLGGVPEHVALIASSPLGFLAPVCESFGLTETGDTGLGEVYSEIPTLVLTGGLDATTPPAWGRMVAETLPNSFLIEFPEEGHGVLNSRCSMSVVRRFLNDPRSEPSTGCVPETPALDFTDPAAEINLIPWRQREFETVRPEDWDLRGDEAHRDGELVPAFAPLDVLRVDIEVAAGSDGYDRMRRIAGGVSGENVGEIVATGTYQAELSWSLFSAKTSSGRTFDFAIQDPDARFGIIVVLVSSVARHDRMYEEVFLPAVEAFREKPSG